MTVEKVSAGQAMQRPQQVRTPKVPESQEVERLSESQRAVGGAPGFDHAAGTLVPPGGGMLANPVVQQYTHVDRESTVDLAEVKHMDVGAAAIKPDKKPAKKPAPKKKRTK
jgi:hypothetical protein